MYLCKPLLIQINIPENEIIQEIFKKVTVIE